MIPRYQSQVMKQIWSDENKYLVWFLVERVYLASYLSARECVDHMLNDRLEQAALRINWHDFAKSVVRYDEEIRHDVIAFLHALEDELGEDARLIHSGLTSSDIVDTAFAYVLKTANDVLLAQLKKVILAIWQKAYHYRGLLCLGRTHGQAAEPTTFGLKLLSHACELARGYDRLFSAAKELAVGKFSGAVGVYALVSPAIEASALKQLGLLPETVSTQIVSRDRHAHYFASLAVLAGSIERLATEIRLLMHGQVKEVYEPFSAKQKGSSAMPHKRNPIISENLCGLMRMVRSYAVMAFENQALWHERDISHSSVERIIAPDATSVMDCALSRLHGLIINLEVDQERTHKNLVDAGDVLKSQAVMLALINQGLLRQKAYELVQKAAQSDHANSFRERLAIVGIEAIIGPDECNRIVQSNQVPAFTEEIFARVKAQIAELL